MRIDLALQRVKAGLKEKALLLFQLHFNAREIPDFNWNGDGCHCGGNDRQQSDWSAYRKGPDFFWGGVMQLQARGLKGNNHQEECGLPVNPRMTQVALHPSVNAQVYER